MNYVIPNTSLEVLADSFLEKVLSKENFGESSSKGGFLTGGNIIVCESKGLQEYLKKKCVDKYGIWAALPFKPLAGTLMQFAYNLSDKKKDEKNCVYNQNNLIWAIYNLLPKGQMQKTFSFANELASLFSGYQIYRSDLIETWNENKPHDIKNDNAEWQRKLWKKLKEKYEDEQDISQLYKIIKENSRKIEKKRIFIFAPLSMPPVHLESLKHLAIAGCEVNLYLHLISSKYIGDTKSDKSVAYLRKISWENKIVPDEDKLYWDLGNRLIANLGRSAQVLYEQIGWDELEPINECRNANSLLEKIQANIINDENEKEKCEKDDTIILNNCFSPLREIEVLCDCILELFAKDKELSPTDIAVVSPNIEPYASAIEMTFGRCKIPYKIADRDVKKHDKTAQLLNLLFSQVGIDGRYEASEIVALFEYSKFVRDEEFDSNDRERLEKWVRENAIRHGLENSNENGEKPDYSFESGFDQLAAGFFMIAETEFSAGKEEYCYPDIEGSSARFLGDFVHFVRSLKKMEEASKKEKSITDWDDFFRKNLQPFFGKDETDFNEEDNPYQKVIGTWDSLKEEIFTGFGDEKDTPVDFSVIKSALLKKMETSAKNPYSLSGNISFSNLETIRAVPHKIICCIGMNGKEFPRQIPSKEISLMATAPRYGDKDTANEDRLMFLETICSAKKLLYISWVGQDEKSGEFLEPSSVVAMLLKNLEEQYEVKEIVVKHPLQPFSEKYFNRELSTYDNRWQSAANGQWLATNGSNGIWEWELDSAEMEEKRDIEDLYEILSNASKYFLRTICNIELPEDIEFLENLEPFIVERGLEEWKLADLILNKKDIGIAKLRGELPSGKLADKIIENVKKEIEELRKNTKDEIPGTFWIYPSKDKGKYRLKHWLHHLDLNLKKKSNTKIFLKDNTILLLGMPKEKAGKILDKLWELKRELGKKMLPIFPNAAWEYINNPKNLPNAWKNLELYSQYEKMAIGKAQSFRDLGIEEKFIEYSEKLFENYKSEKKEAENEKT